MKQDTILHCEEASQLLAFLMNKMGGMSRTSVKQLLSHRMVHIGTRVETRFDYMLKPGDEIRIVRSKGNEELHHPKLRIVYEDDSLIVVEKKVGLLTVATHPGSNEVTVFSLLKNYVRKADSRAGIYVVHRLDRETSGLLVFAKTRELQEYMREYWRELVTRRTYVAVVEGQLSPAEGQIRSWLTEDRRSTVVYSSPVDDGGKLAVTNYRTLASCDLVRVDGNKDGALSLLELNLETGRTNQIRVHMQSKGHPVLGDRKYGHGMDYVASKAMQTTSDPHYVDIDRLCLHARVLEFTHPVTEQTVHFETSIPKEFARLFK